MMGETIPVEDPRTERKEKGTWAAACIHLFPDPDDTRPAALSPATSTFLLWWTAHWAVAETAPSSHGLLLWVYFITAIGKGSKATNEILRPNDCRKNLLLFHVLLEFSPPTPNMLLCCECVQTVSEKLIKPPVSSGSILQCTVEGAVSPPGAASSLLLVWFSSWNVSLKLSLPVAVISVGKAASTNIYSAFSMVQNARADGRNVFPSANLSFSPVVNSVSPPPFSPSISSELFFELRKWIKNNIETVRV